MSDDTSTKRAADERRPDTERGLAAHVVAVRTGHGANCSSIGSVIDTLFASGVVLGAVFAAVCAAMTTEKVTVVAPPSNSSNERNERNEKDDAG